MQVEESLQVGRLKAASILNASGSRSWSRFWPQACRQAVSQPQVSRQSVFCRCCHCTEGAFRYPSCLRALREVGHGDCSQRRGNPVSTHTLSLSSLSSLFSHFIKDPWCLFRNNFSILDLVGFLQDFEAQSTPATARRDCSLSP